MISSACVLLLLAPVCFASFYNDDFGRYEMFPLAAAAYSDNPNMCISYIFGKPSMRRQISVKCDEFSEDICSGYTALLNGSYIVISFRGTDGFLELVEEANESIFSSQMVWIAGGKVSKYFGDAFNRIWNAGMKDDFIALINKEPYAIIYVTGHSLGGSLASLAASYIVATGLVKPWNVILTTFGQPRTGDHSFASAHDAQGMHGSMRVTHWRDVVPHIPKENFEGYYHHNDEAFYKETMQPTDLTICENDEDSMCSDGLTFTVSKSDHLHYFGVDVSDFGKRGCK